MMAMMAGLSQMMAPSMMGMAIGSMVGRLGSAAFGQYDLPIPRSSAKQLAARAGTIDAFAADWSLPARRDAAVGAGARAHRPRRVLGHPHPRRLERSRARATSARSSPTRRPSPRSSASLDIDGDDPMQALQRTLGDPESCSARCDRRQAALAAAARRGDGGGHRLRRPRRRRVAARLIGGDAQRIGEAVRRRRIEASPDDVFVERLLGLQLTRQQVERGKSFIAGVVDRGGERGGDQLFDVPGALPTPAEIDAPGLWLARLEDLTE